MTPSVLSLRSTDEALDREIFFQSARIGFMNIARKSENKSKRVLGDRIFSVIGDIQDDDFLSWQATISIWSNPVERVAMQRVVRSLAITAALTAE